MTWGKKEQPLKVVVWTYIVMFKLLVLIKTVVIMSMSPKPSQPAEMMISRRKSKETISPNIQHRKCEVKWSDFV